MHGRLKIKTTAEKEAAERKERTEKALRFKKGLQLVLSKRSNGERSDECLLLSAQLLSVNPDVYTLWNFRREIIVERKETVLRQLEQIRSNSGEDGIHSNQLEEEFDRTRSNQLEEEFDRTRSNQLEEEFDVMGEAELSLSETCLMKNPKSYSAWFHRQFMLKVMFKPNLMREIELCNGALMKDDRNFHCWDHRRAVSEHLTVPFQEELSFTLDKINSNFSNFSSWYYRSCLIKEALLNKVIRISDIWLEEYEMVENAIFTDPTDQSAWFYHRWLTLTDFDRLESKSDRDFHRVVIERIVTDSSSGLVVIVTSRPVEKFPDSIVIKCVTNEQTTQLTPYKTSDYVTSIWYSHIPTNSLASVEVSTPDHGIGAISDHGIGATPDDGIGATPDHGIGAISDHGIVAIPVSDNSIVIKSFNQKSLSSKRQSYLTEEKKRNLVELMNMEPGNKWVNLMTATCLQPENQIEIYRKLCDIDPLRTNHYKDMISKHALEVNREKWSQSVHCELVHLGLTSFHFTDEMIHLHSLDLSKNELKKLPSKFNDLVSLKLLILDDNLIDSIDPRLKMLSLEALSLQRNRLNNFHQLSNILKHSSRLVKLFVAGNEFQDQVERYKLKSTVVLETESSSFVLPFTTDFKVIYI